MILTCRYTYLFHSRSLTILDRSGERGLFAQEELTSRALLEVLIGDIDAACDMAKHNIDLATVGLKTSSVSNTVINTFRS